MTTFLIILHVSACLILITLVLIQRGRGAGLVESFAGVESMFGTKTNSFLTRTTTIMSVVFFLTCLSLAVLSVRQGKSLMTEARRHRVVNSEAAPWGVPETPADTAKAAAVATPALDATKAAAAVPAAPAAQTPVAAPAAKTK